MCMCMYCVCCMRRVGTSQCAKTCVFSKERERERERDSELVDVCAYRYLAGVEGELCYTVRENCATTCDTHTHICFQFFLLQRMCVYLAGVAVGVVPQLAILKSKDLRFSLSI
jgi:hypothetical protein